MTQDCLLYYRCLDKNVRTRITWKKLATIIDKDWKTLAGNYISIKMWGGKRYDKIENIQRILKPPNVRIAEHAGDVAIREFWKDHFK